MLIFTVLIISTDSQNEQIQVQYSASKIYFIQCAPLLLNRAEWFKFLLSVSLYVY